MESVSASRSNLTFLTGGGEMGALMRAHDWSISPVGPPEDWPQARARAYVDWSRAVAAGLRGINPALEAAFDQAAEQAIAAIETRRAEEWAAG